MWKSSTWPGSAVCLLVTLLFVLPAHLAAQEAGNTMGWVRINSVVDSTFMPPAAKIGSMANESRVRDTDFDLLFTALELQPGDRVLDVGAGIGFLTLPMAKRLENKGLITATDVDPKMLAVLDQGIKKLGLTNIETVVVSTKGVDPKYLQRRYDKILVCHVVQDMADPVDFFKTLSANLEKGGVVVIVHPTAGRFDASPDRMQWESLVVLVDRYGEAHPLVARLSPEVVAGIRKHGQRGLPPELHKTLQADLEAALSDRYLMRDLIGFMDKAYVSWQKELTRSLSLDQFRLFNYLMVRYLDTLFKPTLSEAEQYTVFKVNQIFLAGVMLGGRPSQSFFFERSIVQSGGALKAQLQRAGLEFVQDYYPNQSFVVLKFRKP